MNFDVSFCQGQSIFLIHKESPAHVQFVTKTVFVLVPPFLLLEILSVSLFPKEYHVQEDDVMLATSEKMVLQVDSL